MDGMTINHIVSIDHGSYDGVMTLRDMSMLKPERAHINVASILQSYAHFHNQCTADTDLKTRRVARFSNMISAQPVTRIRLQGPLNPCNFPSDHGYLVEEICPVAKPVTCPAHTEAGRRELPYAAVWNK